MASTTYGDISQRTAAWAATEMLKHAMPRMVLTKMGQTKPIPKNKSEQVKFRRVKVLAAATTPIQEGVTPTAQKFGYEDVTATLKQYGKPIEITDKIMDLSEDPVLKDASQQAGEQAGRTLEQVAFNILKAGTNVVYANGASRASVNTAITLNKQRAITRVLQKQSAEKITKILSASVSISTTAVEAAYVAVGHTDLDSDIRNMAGFIPVAKYGTRQTISDYEIGSVEQVRYVLTPDLQPFLDAGGTPTSVVSNLGSAADVYPVLYFGQDAYAHVPLKGMEAIVPMVVMNKPTDSDPLAQRAYVSWKVWYTAVILNELWMCRLECSASSL